MPAHNQAYLKLRRRLEELYPLLGDQRRLARDSGAPINLIVFEGSSATVWTNILDALQSRKLLDNLREVVAQEPDVVDLVDNYAAELLPPGQYDLDDSETSNFDPLEYLCLFDRITEIDRLRVGLIALNTSPYPPIVLGVLSDREDEYNEFLRHSSAGLLGEFLGNTGANRDSETVDWADESISAEIEIRKLCQKKLNNGYRKVGGVLESIDVVAARVGEALAGRVTTLLLSAEEAARPAMQQKLRAFLALWERFGRHLRPPVLYITVIRYDDTHPDSQQSSQLLELLFNEVHGLATINPITLSFCELKHFDLWERELAAQGRTFVRERYDKFKAGFSPRFRLGYLRSQLQQLKRDGRIYV